MRVLGVNERCRKQSRYLRGGQGGGGRERGIRGLG